MSLLNLRPLHRIVIFAIENHFSLAKCPHLLLVASPASVESYVTLNLLNGMLQKFVH